MKIVSLIIACASFMLSTSLWASANSVNTNHQQIAKFKQNSYAATRPTLRAAGSYKSTGEKSRAVTPVTTGVKDKQKDQPHY